MRKGGSAMRVTVPTLGQQINNKENSGRLIRRFMGNTLWYSAVTVLSLIMLLPLFWMLTIALKGNNDIYKIPPEFWPSQFHWENFVKGVQSINFGRLFLNSVTITMLNTVGAVASSTLVGYGLARIRFSGRKIGFELFVGSMMLPGF